MGDTTQFKSRLEAISKALDGKENTGQARYELECMVRRFLYKFADEMGSEDFSRLLRSNDSVDIYALPGKLSDVSVYLPDWVNEWFK